MIVDYRVYCTIYAVCFAVIYAAIPLPSKLYVRVAGACAGIILGTGLINFLDWPWA